MQSDIVKSVETGSSGSLVEVRRFSNPQLQQSINAALEAATGNSAVIHLEANPTGYNAAIAAKLDGHWSVALGYSRGDWGWAAGSQVKFSW